jgi:hypothetical protein
MNSGILSDWAAPYVTQMLGQTQALAAQPYQVYQGPMTAGESGLQSNVFKGLGSLNFPSQLGQSFSSTGAYQLPNMTPNANQPMGGAYPANVPGTGGGMPPPGGLPPGAMAMPDYASMGMTGNASRAPKTEADWTQFQSLAQFAPGTDMA